MFDVVKNEMLEGLLVTSNGLRKIQLKYQDGTTSSIVTETSFWGSPSSGEINQDANVVFDIDASSGTKSVSGFNLLFEDNDAIGISFNFEQIYSYPTNGKFTFDGTRLLIS